MLCIVWWCIRTTSAGSIMKTRNVLQSRTLLPSLFAVMFKAVMRVTPDSGKPLQYVTSSLQLKGKCTFNNCTLFLRLWRRTVSNFLLRHPARCCSGQSKTCKSTFLENYLATWMLYFVYFMSIAHRYITVHYVTCHLLDSFIQSDLHTFNTVGKSPQEPFRVTCLA